MVNLTALDDLARRLSELVPPGLDQAGQDLEKHFKAVLQAGLQRLELVTREEFDVQRAVLLRTRQKLEELEASVHELEQRDSAG